MKLEEIIWSMSTGVVVKRYVSEEQTNLKCKVLTLKAMQNGRVIEEDLDEVFLRQNLGDEKFTHEGDIIIKLNRPYDAVLIDREVNYLIPSFCARLRGIHEIDSYYLVAMLNSEQTRRSLRNFNGASPAALLKMGDLRNLNIPVIPMERQKKIGEAYRLYEQHQRELEILKNIETNMMSKIINDSITGDQICVK